MAEPAGLAASPASIGSTTPAAPLLTPETLATFHFRLRLVSIVSHALLFVATLVAVFRTLRYVLLRRSGRTGPAHATRLVKFWSAFGLMNAAHTVFASYLTPFGLAPMVTAPLAIAAVALSVGPRLSMAGRAYDGPLSIFYETHAGELDSTIATLREHLGKVDEATCALAEYLLQHLSVGGLSGMGRAFTNLFSEAAATEADAAVQGERRRRKQGEASLPEGSSGGRDASGGRDRIAPGTGSRSFFAGAPHERADAAAESPNGFVSANLKDARPKPAYDASRALRDQFRRRRSLSAESSTGDTDSAASLDAMPEASCAPGENGDVRRRRR